MPRLKWTWLLILFGSNLLVGQRAFTQGVDFPWDRVVGFDPSSLQNEQRVRVVELADQIPNYYGCRGTVAECIAQDPPDPTAQRLAGYLARRVVEGTPISEINRGVANRRRSAHPRQLATIDLAEASCLGAEDALVTVVEFGDFECPFCRVASPILERLVTARPGQARFCFKYFPIRNHPRGVPSCIAGLAAARQGRFWSMHDALYETAPDLSDEALERAARNAGLDIEQFRQDIASEALLEEVMADKFEGQELGVDRTPTIFINAKQYYGELTEAELADRIDEELDLVLEARGDEWQADDADADQALPNEPDEEAQRSREQNDQMEPTDGANEATGWTGEGSHSVQQAEILP